MKFLALWLIFLVIGMFVCLVAGPAAVLVFGFLFVFVLMVIGETQKTRTPKGRRQIRKKIEKEKKIEQYWGTIDYWEDNK